MRAITGLEGIPRVKQRNEGGLGAGVIGGFGGGHTFDGALAEFGRVLRDFLFDGIGCKGSENGAAAGQDTQGRAENGPAENRPHHALPVLFGRHRDW